VQFLLSQAIIIGFLTRGWMKIWNSLSDKIIAEAPEVISRRNLLKSWQEKITAKK